MHKQAITFLLTAIAAESVLAAPSHGHQRFHVKKDAEPNWQDVDYSKLTYTSYSAGFGTWGSWSPQATGAPAASPAQAPTSNDNQGQAQPQTEEKQVSNNSGSSDSDKSSDKSSNSGSSDNSDNSGSSGSSTSSGMAAAGSGVGQTVSKALNNVGSLMGATGGQDTGNKDTYVGNTGSQYGGNFAMVDSQGSHKYTIDVKNDMSSQRRFVVWNKVGKDGQMTGFFPGANPPAIDIMLSPGQSQMIAVGDNTQGGMCDWTDGKTASIGAYDCSWAEFDFGDSRNAGGNGAPSGFDISNIISNKLGGGSGDCAISMKDTVSGYTANCNKNCYETDNQAVNPDATTAVPIGGGNPVHLQVSLGK